MNNNTLSLNGSWRLYFAPEHSAGLAQTPMELSNWPAPPIEALVPGNVELDLMRAGLEADPFYGENLYAYRKYEFYTWWFVRDFEIPADYANKALSLCFDGLDTFTTIWLNGTVIGHTDNMLIPHKLDITPYAKPGATNTIAVHIHAAMNRARAQYFPAGIRIWEHTGDEMLYIRKAPHSFGWDISARLLSAGLWRDVTVQAAEKTHIREVYYATQALTDRSATLAVRWRIFTDSPMFENLQVRVSGVSGTSRFEQTSAATFVSGKLTIEISNPTLWWPRGYGEPHLYDVTFELLENGNTVDLRQEKIGLRKIDLIRSYGDDCGEFLFKCNHVPILVKGANWVHLDCLHSRDIHRLEKIHAGLCDLQCNMVRCWGGNVYESDAFFDLCDREGIMVWQDFAMGCAAYSQLPEFREAIKKEATATIIRLRNHASLALWAGDNEVDQNLVNMGHTLPHAKYNAVTREELPLAIQMHDPMRDYIPSSPYLPEGELNEYNVPEQHNWGARDYFKGDFYKNSTAHFISETGYHGCPSVTSLRKYLPEEQLWPIRNDTAWRTHNADYKLGDVRNYDRTQLMTNQIRTLFGDVPPTLEEYVLASQISSAEAHKFFVETTRIKKWRRTGILWWNLADGWPQPSEATIDYFYNKKLAYYYLRRIQQPTCLIMGEPHQWQYPLFLCNDGNRDFEVCYSVTDADTGMRIQQGSLHSKANQNAELPPIPCTPGEQKLYLLAWEVDGVRYGNHYASGFVPMSFPRYRDWLGKIQALDQPFDATGCYM